MVLLKQKDFAISKSRGPDNGCTSVSIPQGSLWGFFLAVGLFGFFTHFDMNYRVVSEMGS